MKISLSAEPGKGRGTKTMTLPAHYTDLQDGGKQLAGKSGVETYKVGWTDDKPALPAAGPAAG
ncbi:hypothetical protein [Nonomuraea jabiensis]|uniref:hypothetical protein n=1 Tax=Nonomuraea jabiensis TaxID=882448 RepID=UPI003D74A7A8